MISILRYFLFICKKDKIFLSLALLILGCFSTSLFFGWTMIDEIKQAQAVYFAGSVRFVLIFCFVVFICFFISKFFLNKELEFLCSLPQNRTTFLLSLFTCFTVIALICTGFVGALFIYFHFTSPIFSLHGLLIWLATLFAELLIVSIFAIFLSLSYQNPAVSIIVSVLFYLVARSIGFITSALYTSASASSTILFLPQNKILAGVSSFSAKFLGVFFPRLDLLANSSWIIYGNFDPKTLATILLQIIVYTALIFALSLFDFKKKEF